MQWQCVEYFKINETNKRICSSHALFNEVPFCNSAYIEIHI